MAPEVFISYLKQNKKFADAICDRLEADGVPCWYAPRALSPEADPVVSIMDAVEQAKIMVAVFSGEPSEAPQTASELSMAYNSGVTVIPCKISGAQPSKSPEEISSQVRAILGKDSGQTVPAPAPSWRKQLRSILIAAGLISLGIIAAGILFLNGGFGDHNGRKPDNGSQAANQVSTGTAESAELPTETATEEPTAVPTEAPTETPTPAPTEIPTANPNNSSYSFKPQGMAVIHTGAKTYTVPANSLYTLRSHGMVQQITRGIEFRESSETVGFTSLPTVTDIEIEPFNDGNEYHKNVVYHTVDGNVLHSNAQTSFTELCFPENGQTVCIKTKTVESIHFDWDVSVLNDWPEYAMLMMNNGEIYTVPAYTLTVGGQKRPPETQISFNNFYDIPDQIKTSRGYTIDFSELKSITFGEGIYEHEHWSSGWKEEIPNGWIVELPMTLCFRDGRTLDVHVTQDWFKFFALDEYGPVEAKPNEISHIVFVDDITEKVPLPNPPEPALIPTEEAEFTYDVNSFAQNKHKAGDYEPKGTVRIRVNDGSVLDGIANSIVMVTNYSDSEYSGSENFYTGIFPTDKKAADGSRIMISFLELVSMERDGSSFTVTDDAGNTDVFELPTDAWFWFIGPDSEYEPVKVKVSDIDALTFDREATPDTAIKYATVYCEEGNFRAPAAFVGIRLDSGSGPFQAMKISQDFSQYSGYPVRINNLDRLIVKKQGLEGSMFAAPTNMEILAELKNGETVEFEMGGYYSIYAMAKYGMIDLLPRSSLQAIIFDE
ncbi:MAG: toll/interleukin-1 receptor domain-containing protein [Anaerolineaceae bacterium]|nr:toll/interleukin-1 receptor domain-containing protein [Anaerolineaceae bacterium]